MPIPGPAPLREFPRHPHPTGQRLAAALLPTGFALWMVVAADSPVRPNLAFFWVAAAGTALLATTALANAAQSRMLAIAAGLAGITWGAGSWLWQGHALMLFSIGSAGAAAAMRVPLGTRAALWAFALPGLGIPAVHLAGSASPHATGAAALLVLALLLLLRCVPTAPAASAEEAKADFLGAVSHEVRSPLGRILGLIELAEDGPLDSKQRQYLDRAASAASELLQVFDDLADYVEAGKGDLGLQRDPFRPADLIRDLVDHTGPRAAEKNLPVHLEISPEVPEVVLGDARRLRRICRQLIDNAIKFTPAGEVRVRLETSRSGKETQLRVRVDDTGIGINPGRLEELFQPFVQAQSGLSRANAGLGLGLPIARRLTALLRGRLTAESAPGNGSRFTLSVPVDLPEPSVDQPLPAAAPAAPAQPRFAGRVLLVEDDAVNQRIAKLMLERAGLEVGIISRGNEAPAAAIGTRWNLIFMDLQLPGLDGLEATREIRRREKESGLEPTPIIALSANSGSKYRLACREAGMDDFLAKPIRRELLLETLSRWLGPS